MNSKEVWVVTVTGDYGPIVHVFADKADAQSYAGTIEYRDYDIGSFSVLAGPEAAKLIAAAEAALAELPPMCEYGEHRPDDMPGPGDRCKDCQRSITWIGPGPYDWATFEQS